MGLLFLSSSVHAKGVKHKIYVAVFDSRLQDVHAKKVLDLFSQRAKECQVQLFPIYDDRGQLDLAKFQKSLENLPPQFEVIHLSWNQFFEPQFQGVVTALNLLIAKGRVIVAAGGESQELNRMNGPLKETVMGGVQNAILVGELDAKGKLTSRAFFGPELTAAWLAPEGYKGSSFSSVLMTAEVCKSEESKKEMFARLRAVKERSTKIWPPLKDYFN